MAGVNKAIIVGRLGKDPDHHTTKSSEVVNMSVATSRKWKDNNNEWVEDTQWHRVTAWGKLADTCKRYLSKGSQVYIEGRIETRSYEKDGEKRYVTEIVAHTVQFLDGKGNGEGRRDDSRRDDRDRRDDRNSGRRDSGRRDSGRRQQGNDDFFSDDDIPF